MSKMIIVACAICSMLVACTSQPTNTIADQGGKSMQSDSQDKFVGQCHCGAVKYEAVKPVVKCSYCDCQGCQRATGSLKAPFVTVKQDGFKILAGKVTEFKSDSGIKCDAHGKWYFCSQCGGHLYWQSDNGGDVDLFAGSLNDKSIFVVAD